MTEDVINQYAQNKTLDGSVHRDYFGSLKRIWTLSFKNVNKTDYDVIRAIYNTYLSTATAVAWQVTETNYTIPATTVHLNLDNRGFSTKGTDYLSDFSLILTEA